MSAQTIIGPISGLGSGVFPSLIFVQGTEQRTLYLDHSPFSVGRKMEKDLVIADPKVATAFSDSHIAQMIGYLNITGLKLALLLNFKHARLEWKRIVN